MNLVERVLNGRQCQKRQVKIDRKYSINIIYLRVNERRDTVSRGMNELMNDVTLSVEE
jgi:hypothetical protein